MNSDKPESRVITILNSLKQAPGNGAFMEKADVLTFLISLLPIPGLSQAGQIANKLLNDAALSSQLDSIRAEVFAANQRIDGMENDLIRVGEIAKTVSSITAIERKVEHLCEEVLKTLVGELPQLHIETVNWSVQRFINALIQVNWVAVTADNNSRNHFHNTRIEAERTDLRATNRSENTFQGTTFTGRGGTVGMDGVAQSGDVHVEGAAVGFGPGGQIGFAEGGVLSFGPPADEVFADCPACQKRIFTTKAALRGKDAIQCCHCKSVHRFRLPL